MAFRVLGKRPGLSFVATDSHAVERLVYEEERRNEENQSQKICNGRTLAVRKGNCQFDGEEPKERGEFNDWV